MGEIVGRDPVGCNDGRVVGNPVGTEDIIGVGALVGVADGLPSQ